MPIAMLDNDGLNDLQLQQILLELELLFHEISIPETISDIFTHTFLLP